MYRVNYTATGGADVNKLHTAKVAINGCNVFILEKVYDVTTFTDENVAFGVND